jgi:hypothetical protein
MLTPLTSILRSSQAERFREEKNKHRFKGIQSQFSGAEPYPNSIVDNLKIVSGYGQTGKSNESRSSSSTKIFHKKGECGTAFRPEESIFLFFD